MTEIPSDEFEFNLFEKASLNILTQLVSNDNIDVKIIDFLRELHIEYYSLLGKYKIAEEKANIDAKTSLLKYNEVFLVNIIKTISRYWESSNKTNLLPITYIRIDLDNFRNLNNRYGHAVGDRALIKVAEVLKKNSRPTDYVFRFGGEEFDVVLPVTPIEGAITYLEKIIKAIRNIKVVIETEEEIRVSASIGVSSFNFDFSLNKSVLFEEVVVSYRNVQKEADHAVYDAKFQGKDRYCIYDPSKDYKMIMESYSSK